MTPETIGQIVLLGMKIYLQIAEDIPKERRVQMWEDWFKFCDGLRNFGK